MHLVLEVIGDSSCIGEKIDDEVGDETRETTAAGEGEVICEESPIVATGEKDMDCDVRSRLTATEAIGGEDTG